MHDDPHQSARITAGIEFGL